MRENVESNEILSEEERKILAVLRDFAESQRIGSPVSLQQESGKDGKWYLEIFLAGRNISFFMRGEDVEVEFMFQTGLQELLRAAIRNLRGKRDENPYEVQNKTLSRGTIDFAHGLRSLITFINSPEGLHRRVSYSTTDEQRKRIYKGLAGKYGLDVFFRNRH